MDVSRLLALRKLGCSLAVFSLTTFAALADDSGAPVLDLEISSIEKLRGFVELSYRSAVDGTDQPFILAIPDNYDPEKKWPLAVMLHGWGQSLPSHRRGEPHSGEAFSLVTHGRAPGVGYLGLSEIDVLEAMEVVIDHWNIDRRRIHLTGGSMGGFGAYRIAARFPDRFASLRSFAGSGLGRPLENLLNVPVLGVHGDADHPVPVCLGRSSIEAVQSFGGSAKIDVLPGVGHSIPFPKKNQAARWSLEQVLPDKVTKIQYTATDEKARGAYWARVEEWGPRGMPARIDAQVEGGSVLRIDLENVRTARFDLHAAPLDRVKALEVLVGEESIGILAAPLPKYLWAFFEEDRWKISATAPKVPQWRLHFPGGYFALQHGEPLLIVRGTRGGQETSARLKEVAELASRSADGKWPENGTAEKANVFQMTTGRIPVKADTEVTAGDIERCNLLLLGDASQNSLVKRMADRLSVKIRDGSIVSDDGISWDYANRAFGLLNPNPLAEHRLIYWVAADELEFYRAGTIMPISTLMDYQGSIEAPADFMITNTGQDQLIAARRFDSRWNWEAGYADSPVLKQSISAGGPKAVKIATAIRQQFEADFGATNGRDWYSFNFTTAPGVTRKMDVMSIYYGERAATLELTGKQLVAADTAFRSLGKTPAKSSADWNEMSVFAPLLGDPDGIDPKQRYRIAFPEWAAFTFGRYAGVPTGSLELTDIYLRDIIERHLLVDE